jgi:CRP/FNR family cyclic AMP-dependent transcriptional regulator
MPDVAQQLGALVLSLGAPIALPAGEALFSEGDRSGSVYACRAGRLKITVSTPGGDELLLGWKGPGEGFGELSALDGAPRSARVVAVVDSELASIGRAEFVDALRRTPEVAVALLVELSAHLRGSNDRVAAYKSERIPVSVAQRLIELSAQLERHGGGRVGGEITVTHDDLAGWVGATRESTTRALAMFRRQGLIETGRGRIVVLDRAGLERIVRDRVA